MELVKGQIVISRKGRDVTKAYVVLQVNADRALLCNGEKWSLAQPKKKNPLHIQPTNTVVLAKEMEDDLTIRRAILHFDEKRAPKAARRITACQKKM